MHGTHPGGFQFWPTHGLRVRRLGGSMNLGYALILISMQIKLTQTDRQSVSRVWLSGSKLPAEIQVLVMQIACLELRLGRMNVGSMLSYFI